VRGWCRLLAGGIAGMASRAAVAPLERMRTMFMADPSQRTMQGGEGQPSQPRSALFPRSRGCVLLIMSPLAWCHCGVMNMPQ
jgi:hypothetical protein